MAEVTLERVTAALADGLSVKTRQCAARCAIGPIRLVGDVVEIGIGHGCSSPDSCTTAVEIRQILADIGAKVSFVRLKEADKGTARCWRRNGCDTLLAKQSGRAATSST